MADTSAGSDLLNLALLGTGRIANDKLAPAMAAAEGVRLWSVLSRSGPRAADFAARHEAAAPEPAHDDLDRLLADPELDGVVVATPDGLHAEQAVAAARAGKHVFTEKPMATSSEDARAMIRTCREAGVTLGVAYHLRWHAGHRRIVMRVREGALGELRHVRALWSWPADDDSNWRAHPEVGRWWSLAGVGTHCLDLIRWLSVPESGEVADLEALATRSVWEGPHDETAVVSLRFERGCTAELCSSVLFPAPSRLEVYGSDGWITATGSLGPHGRGRIETPDGTLDFEPVNPYRGEMEDFARAVRTERAPEVDGTEGLRNVELLERIEEKAGLPER